MKQLFLTALAPWFMATCLFLGASSLLTVSSCNKEKDSITQVESLNNSNWVLTITPNGAIPQTRVIYFDSHGTVMGGTWTLHGNSFSMRLVSTNYSGTLSGNTITGTTTDPIGTFKIVKQ